MLGLSSSRTREVAAFLIVVGFVCLWGKQAAAIPAFARTYRLSCTTCHAPPPHLKAYGEDFAANAFQLEGKEPVRAFRDTGDPLLTLQRELPIAIRFDSYASLQSKRLGRTSDFQWPYYMKILSGGQIARNVGYYLYFLMSERGEVAGVEDAYVYFNDLLGVDLDVTAGQFQVSDPLFKRELRLTLEDYQIYRVRVGRTPSNLTYDRGVTVAYGSPFGLDVVAEVINGNGIGPAENPYTFDSDNWKNFALRASQSVGPARLGAFAYLGRARFLDATNKFSYFGVDGTLDLRNRLQLNAQYLERYDDNPFFLRHPHRERTVRGGFVEAIWAVQGEMGRLFAIALYNRVDPARGLPELRYETATLSLTYLLRRNLRVVIEGTRDLELRANRLSAGFVSAF
ncbi:MAG: hypothetical protein ONB23_01960 [candidate division KSB1 bacterium]|nr:hypothetical protein [candidate division KSB1 bacterium]